MTTYNANYPHPAILTNFDDPRIQVDEGSTGFFLGREFRFFYEFNISNAQSAWVKVDVGVNSTLKMQSLTVDSGGVRFRAWRGGTENGPFSAPAGPSSGWFNLNPPAETEYSYVGQNAVTIGGNNAVDTDGTVAEIVRVLTAGATAQKTSVGFSGQKERGIAAGTYYLQIENIASSGAATGVYDFVLEER